MTGPRVIEIAFDCDPLDQKTVSERLVSITAFAIVVKAQLPYRWAVRLSLHPLVQNRSAKEMVGEVMKKLDIAPMTFVAWNDSAEVR